MHTYRMKGLVIALLMVGVATGAFSGIQAQSESGETHTVAFDGFSFSFASALATNVNIVQYPGDPVDLEQPGGPEVRHTEFLLYHEPPAPAPFESPAVIRIYRTADFPGYAEHETRFQLLRDILSERPDLGLYTAIVVGDDDTDPSFRGRGRRTSRTTLTENISLNMLPFLPVLPAGQVIRARPQYVELPTITGISYVTVYRQDVSPFVSNDFLYTFQGLSADEAYYVSAFSRLTTEVFPTELPSDFDPEAFMEQLSEYFAQSVAQLNDAAPDAFTPSLTTLDAMVQSFAFAP